MAGPKLGRERACERDYPKSHADFFTDHTGSWSSENTGSVEISSWQDNFKLGNNPIA
jgi:hypothetical protein